MKIFEVESKNLWYHGSPTEFEAFDISHSGTGTGHDQEGPGIYLTDDENEAFVYAGKTGVVYTVELQNPRWMKISDKIPKLQIEKLIKAAPNLHHTLTNWDERPAVAFKTALNAMIESSDTNKQAFESVWFDFYLNDAKLWLVGMTRLGYDGFIIDKASGSHHAIVFNPQVVHIVKKQRV